MEVQSRLAFETALPQDWVFRSINPDYGIDGLVEVFSKYGSATGDMFFVQLKSTSLNPAEAALKVRLKSGKAAYYSCLPIPLLMVSYHCVSKEMYVKFYAQGQHEELDGARDTFYFHFSRSDLWSNKVPDLILDYLMHHKSTIIDSNRRSRIEKYYLGDREFFPEAKGTRLMDGMRVEHSVFGEGVVENGNDNYVWVKFDGDKYSRQFYRTSSHEFRAI